MNKLCPVFVVLTRNSIMAGNLCLPVLFVSAAESQTFSGRRKKPLDRIRIQCYNAPCGDKIHL